jgi:GNAT superfamily N-acetyltransferase
MAVIRPIEASDCRDLAKLGLELHLESQRYGETTDFRMDRAMAFAREHLEWPHRAWVAIEAGEAVGMFLAHATRVPYGDTTIAVENVFFVKDGHRGTRAGIKLIRAYIDWAKEIGASYAMVGVTTGIHEARTEKLLEHLGFEDFGQCMRVVF